MTTRKPLVLIGGIPTALPTGDDIGLQPKSNLLTSVAALSTAPDQLMYLTGTDTAALTSLSTFSRTQLANADAATWRTNLAVAALASPTLTGVPLAPTAAVNTNTTQIATTAFVAAQITASAQPLHANLTSIAAVATNVTGLLKITNGVASIDSNTYLTANQSITFTGDATGSGTTAVTMTLADSGVTAGTYGGNFTVDVKGRVTAVSLGQLTLDTKSTTNATIELGAQGFANTPYIDFHSGATLTDYDARIIASGGTGSNGGGTLTYTAAVHAFNTRPTFAGNTAWDNGNLAPTNPPMQMSSTAAETQSTFWMEEVENTGEGCISMSGNIGGITTKFEAGRILYCKDSTGDLWFTALNKV